MGFLPIPPRRPGNRGSERCSDSRQGTPLSRRRWEAALLPGPGRRAARGDSHKDHVVSCPVPSSPGTRSIHHRDSRDGGGSERAARTRGTRRPRAPPPLTSRTSSSGNPGAGERTSRRFHQPPAGGSDRGNLQKAAGREQQVGPRGGGRGRAERSWSRAGSRRRQIPSRWWRAGRGGGGSGPIA